MFFLKNKERNKGYSLIELLIYVAIFAISAALLSSILVTFTRVQTQTSIESEITNQLSFVQATIQRLVRNAANIQNAAGTASSSLVLRMASSTLDPTIISSDANGVYLQQGGGPVSALTNDKVVVSNFQVVKYENPGGHAIVQVDISLTYNTPTVYQQITRSLKTAIGRVTAATFDDNLVPNEGDTYTVGLAISGNWKNIYASDGTASLPSYTFGSDSNTDTGLFRPAENTLAFSTNGAEKMRIDSSGNVGIGTAGPTFSSGFFGLNISDVGNEAVDPAIRLTETGSLHGNFEIRSTRSGSGNMLQLGEGTSTFMTLRGDDDSGDLTSRGNIGIGTTTPSEKLYIYQATAGQYLKTVLNNGNNTPNNALAFASYDATVGTTTAQFAVFGTNYNAPLFAGFGSVNAGKVLIASNENDADGVIKFITVNGGNYGERMRIANNGNVGIGTTDTSLAELTFGTAGSLTPGSSMDLRFGGQGAFGFRSYDDGIYNYLALDNIYGSWQSSPSMTIRADGNIGLSTAPTSDRLTVNGTVHASTFTGNGAAVAWVNFNGATGAVRASYNVPSVSHVSTGVYQVNFTNYMVDTNYSAIVTVGAGPGDCSRSVEATAYATNYVQIETGVRDGASNVHLDTTYINVVIYR